MASAFTQVPDPLADAIGGLSFWVEKPFFVQIGAKPDKAAELLYPHVMTRDLPGLVIDPLPEIMEAVRKRYQDRPQVKAIPVAVAAAGFEGPMLRFQPNVAHGQLLPPPVARITSFALERLLADDGPVGQLCQDRAARVMLHSLTEPVPVTRTSIGDLLDAQEVARIDILLIDVDGYEMAILREFDFPRWRPALVWVGHQLMDSSHRSSAVDLLMENGYQLNIGESAILATLDPALRLRADLPALSGLAARLMAEERLDEAAALLSHLRSFGQDDGNVQQLSLQTAIAQEDLCTAEAALLALRKLGFYQPSHDAVLPFLMSRLSVRFNELLAENSLDEAARIITLAGDLWPTIFIIIHPAMRLNWQLDRLPEARRFARLVIEQQPDHEEANLILYMLAKDANDLKTALKHLKSLVSLEEPKLDTYVQLNNVLALVTHLLCRDRISKEDMPEVRAYLAKAEQLAALPAQDEDQAQKWNPHFLMNIRGVALADRLETLPGGSPVPPTRYVTTRGAPLTLEQVRERANRLGVRAVMLVAADEVYFRRYARMFVLSVLRCSDTPCLIITHVIGGETRLAELAGHFGFNSEHVVLTADAFDVGAVTTECIAEPKNMPITKPIAHFQSVRFQLAEHFLATLDLPVMAADIDSLVQWGMGKLLDRLPDSDVLLNRNNMALGSHITANLVLIRPTRNGRLFSNFLRQYLDLALQGEKVSRWIDQIALLMVRNHMMMHHPDTIFGYFDPRTDINNTMMRRYEPLPFRILSLYQEFDLTTLHPLLRQWERDLSLPPGPLPDDAVERTSP